MLVSINLSPLTWISKLCTEHHVVVQSSNNSLIRIKQKVPRLKFVAPSFGTAVAQVRVRRSVDQSLAPVVHVLKYPWASF